jgi:Ser/Thr protein kinase RdoA (MazF antagonist)
VLEALGALIRRAHDAQAGFDAPPDWHEEPLEPLPGVATTRHVVCHHDLFPPNVILRDGLPAAVVDWDFAGPASALYHIASAANHWVPLRPDEQAQAWDLDGLPRAERLRLLCDAYALDAAGRGALLEVVAHRNRMGDELHRRNGSELRLPGWREMWDAGSGDEILARSAWFEEHRADLRRSLA